MCWYGTLKDKKIANKDIRCKKVIAYNPIDEYYYPFYAKTGEIKRYKIGETYNSVIGISKIGIEIGDYCDYFAIMEGLHAYAWDTITEVEQCDDYSFKVWFRGEKKWYHPFYANPFKRRYPVLVECIIPKGATYYDNSHGEIVSDSLKLVKIIEINK